MQKNIPEGKSLEWYQAEIKKKEQEIETIRNRLARDRQRMKYIRSDKDRARNHRLIQYGVAFESQYQELSRFSVAEIYALIESILSLPEVQRKIHTACFDHIVNGDDNGSLSL